MSCSTRFVQIAGAGTGGDTDGSEGDSVAKMPSQPNFQGDLKALVMITLEEQISKVLTGLINSHIVRLESSLKPAVEASLTVIKSEVRKMMQTELSDIVLKVHRHDATEPQQDQLKTLLQAEMMGVVVQLEDVMRRECRRNSRTSSASQEDHASRPTIYPLPLAIGRPSSPAGSRQSPQRDTSKFRGSLLAVEKQAAKPNFGLGSPRALVQTDPGRQPIRMAGKDNQTFDGNQTIASKWGAPVLRAKVVAKEKEMEQAVSRDSTLRTHGFASEQWSELCLKKANRSSQLPRRKNSGKKSVSLEKGMESEGLGEGDEQQERGLQGLQHAWAAAQPVHSPRDQDGRDEVGCYASGASSCIATASDKKEVPSQRKSSKSKLRSRMSGWGGDKEDQKSRRKNTKKDESQQKEKNMQAKLDTSAKHSWAEFVAEYRDKNERPPIRKCLEWLVYCDYFNYAMGLILLLNAFMMGVQADYFATHEEELSSPFFFGISDTLFCVVFSAEVVMRLIAFGFMEFACGDQKRWNWFDVLIVSLQIFDEVVKVALDGSSSFQKGMANLGVIRMLRLGKLARLVRMVRLIPELKSLVCLISASIGSFFWSMMLILMMMYVFGIYYTEMVTDLIAEKKGVATDEEIASLKKYWGNLSVSVFSLWMAISGGDDWRNFVDVLKLDQVYVMHALFFVAYVAFGTLVMLNLVTGVFVEGAQRIIKEDKDNELLVIAAAMFRESGMEQGQDITVDDFNDRLQSGAMDEYIEAIGINMLEAEHLFEALDRDRSGEISLLEFVQGCLRLRGPARSVDISELGFRMRDYMVVVEQHQTELGQMVQHLANEQDRQSKDVYKLIRAVKEHDKQVKNAMLAVMGHDETNTHGFPGDHVLPGQLLHLHSKDEVWV